MHSKNSPASEMTESKGQPPLSAPERVCLRPTTFAGTMGIETGWILSSCDNGDAVPYVPEAKLKEAEAEIAKMNSVNIFLASDMLDAAGKRDEFKAEADKLPVTTALLHEIMRAGTTQDGNTIEAILAYEALAYLAGERSIDDLKRIKALPAEFFARIEG